MRLASCLLGAHWLTEETSEETRTRAGEASGPVEELVPGTVMMHRAAEHSARAS